MANDGHIAKDTLFGPERFQARAIDWDQSDRGLSSRRAAIVLHFRRRIHGRNRNHAGFYRKTLAQREPSIHVSDLTPAGPVTTGRALEITTEPDRHDRPLHARPICQGLAV